MFKSIKMLTAAMVGWTLLFGASTATAAVETPVIHGFMATSDEWRDRGNTIPKYGFYSFPADGSSGFAAVSPIGENNEWALNGGVYIDGKYYCYSYGAEGNWMRHTLTYRVIDSANWTVEKSKSFEYTSSTKTTEEAQIANRGPVDLAYDAINDVIYAITCKFGGEEATLCTVDRNTGVTTVVGSIPRMVAITATSTGELLGIAGDGNLYKVNTDATTTKVGATGYFPKLDSEVTQSMTVNYKDGSLYWSAYCFASSDDRNYNRNGVFGMIKVDPATGKGTVLFTYPRQERFTSVNILNAHPQSPDDIKDLVFQPASFESREGRVMLTVPSVTMTNTALSGNLTIRVYVDEVLKLTKQAAAGSKFDESVGTLTDGSHSVAVEAEYNGHVGNRAYASTYVGNDTPAKVEKVTLVAVDGNRAKARISWTAPTLGSKGAPYDPAKIRYRVVRYPDETVVKRSATETTVDDDLDMEYTRVFYAVTPYNVDRPTEMGATTTSNGMHMGQAMSIPYSEKFDSQRDFQGFTTIDANNDAGEGGWEDPCWKWDEQYACAFYYGKRDMPADDWLITPPLKLDVNKLYRLTYKYYGYYGYGNHFQVAVGNAATVEGMGRMIQDVEKTTNAYDAPGIETSVLFAPHEGDQFIGFHHMSTTMEHLSIDDILVEEVGDSRVPAEVIDLTLKRISSESARIEFEVPAVDAGGRALDGKLTAKIFRNGAAQPTKTFDVKVGEQVNWLDETAVKGPNTYKVLVENSFGDGLATIATIDLSDAIPEALTNIQARYINDRQVEITWDAITSKIGANGNPIDPDEIRYTVYKPIRDPEGNIEYRVVGYDLETPRFMHDNPLLGAERKQQLAYYMVSAINPAGEGYAMATNNIFAGPAYALPFAETWYQQTQETEPWVKTGLNGADWYIRHKGYDPMAEGADGYGVLTCEVNTGYEQGLGTILTPRIDLSSMTQPKASLQIYRGPEYKDGVNFIVGITTDEHPTVTYLTEVIPAKAATAGWETINIDLARYAKEPRASLVLMANVMEGNHIHIDDFKVTGTEASNIIRADYITGPAEATEKSTYVYRGYVRNYNNLPATQVEAKLMAGDQVVATTTIASVPAKGSAYTEFEFTPAQANVGTTVLTLTAGNSNYAVTKEVAVAEFNPAHVADLRGTDLENTVLLAWSVPTVAEKAQKATEGFENYESFAIENLGPWTLHDGDGFLPFQFSDGQGGKIEWPHYDLPQAYTVYDPAMLPNAPEAYNGSKSLISWGSPYGANNDWLISPELPGTKQVISFFSRAFGGGKEEYQVLVSDSDDSPESFVSLSGSTKLQASADWEYNFYTLPEGTLYFAIKYMGESQVGFMVDDIRFFGFHNYEKPEGYNIYRDGKKVNTELLTKEVFEDTGVNPKDGHVYTVRAVYHGEEGVDSNEYRSGQVGIGSVDASGAQPTVQGLDGMIKVAGAAGTLIEAYRPDGVMAARFAGRDSAEIAVPAGVYIVRIGNYTTKVIVK